jgi:hypothetical protein
LAHASYPGSARAKARHAPSRHHYSISEVVDFCAAPLLVFPPPLTHVLDYLTARELATALRGPSTGPRAPELWIGTAKFDAKTGKVAIDDKEIGGRLQPA